ncbi:hypothetical protein PV10_03675 [Exophiala mesophila]|uniref:Zn(2)-C6 fungal-type domain-containing protein n=1 Tax=Exophiala mesophila TaxID=212818 RepID=A0A0D1ZCF0_EXOME|nr:uncharacterized protein PV10_03675 [Exophiala mesophila]KIV92367.1 hypothetical protein PV10_03675 [Exophiala mesophila]
MQASASPFSPSSESVISSTKPKRPQKLNRACLECTRRKIRCDGTFPCKNCQTACTQHRCVYRKRSRRTNPSWKTISQQDETLRLRTDLLKQLLPAVDFDRCPGLSKDQVLRVIGNEQNLGSTSLADSVSSGVHGNYEELPDDEFEHEWDEASVEQGTSAPLGDDVNGLDVDRHSHTPLDSASTGAVLSAIFRECPPAHQKFLRIVGSFPRQPSHHSHTTLQQEAGNSSAAPDLKALIGPEFEQAAIDGYFETLHSFIPMIDETWFRHQFSTQTRTDESWQALSNMVIAVGSITAGNGDSHTIYFNRARAVIGFNTFRSGNLDMLQALILLGGLYLYYINSPNTAYLVLGTAFRMAIAMKLQQEFPTHARSESKRASDAPRMWSRAEQRRRIWWCLYCVDGRSGLLLMRPQFNTWDPLSPTLTGNSNSHASTEMLRSGVRDNDADPGLTPDEWEGRSLYYKVRVSYISNQLSDRLARPGKMTTDEMVALDTQLQAWVKASEDQFRLNRWCPKRVKIAQESWCRLANLARLFIGRTYLVRLARDPTAYESFGDDDWRIVSTYQATAVRLIDEICSGSNKDIVIAWVAAFTLFMACLIPLLSIVLARRDGRFSDDAVRDWEQSLDRALLTFKDMEPYRRTVDRYGEVIQALYDGIMTTTNDQNPAATQLMHEFKQSPSLATVQPMTLPQAWDMLDQRDLADFDPFLDWIDFDFTFGDDILAPYPPYPLPD